MPSTTSFRSAPPTARAALTSAIGAVDSPRSIEQDARRRARADAPQRRVERIGDRELVIQLQLADDPLDPIDRRRLLEDGEDALAFGLRAHWKRDDFITGLRPPLQRRARRRRTAAAIAAASATAGRAANGEAVGVGGGFDSVVEVTCDGGDGGLAVGRRERPPADEVGRACHHQAEIGRVGAAVIAGKRVGEFGAQRLAPIRAGRQGHRIAANRDDRVIGRHRVERKRLGDDAVAQQLA